MPTTKTSRAWSRPHQRRGKSASPMSGTSGNPRKDPRPTLHASKDDKPYLAAVNTKRMNCIGKMVVITGGIDNTVVLLGAPISNYPADTTSQGCTPKKR